MIGKFFRKNKAAATAAAQKIDKRDLMEAIVGGSLLVIYADGSVEDSELASLEALIAANPSLGHFGSEIGVTISKFTDMFDAGYRMGKMKVLREIDDVKTTPQEAEEVFVTMLTIAEADGEVDAKEEAVLREVAKTLGIDLKKFDM